MPDKTKPNKITVICTANICRSPLGERLLAQALSKEKDSARQLQVVSAGVSKTMPLTKRRISAQALLLQVLQPDVQPKATPRFTQTPKRKKPPEGGLVV